MLTYKVKPTDSMPMATADMDKKHYPTVYFPVSAEILKALEVGEDTTFTLKGKVVALENRENSAECRMEVHEVSMAAEGEFEKLSKDDDE